MSRIGKLPIVIPSNVDIKCSNLNISVKGQFGTLENTIPEVLQLHKEDNVLIIKIADNTRTSRAIHGLYRTLINNMIIGVSEQFTLTLILQGVGYRANIQGKEIILNLGFSHPVTISIPEQDNYYTRIDVEIIHNTKINLKSRDEKSLLLFAAKIRSWRAREISVISHNFIDFSRFIDFLIR